MKIRLKIASTEYQDNLLEDSWEIDDNDGNVIDTIGLTLLDTDNSISISENDDLIVEDFNDSSTRFFGGIVSEILMEPEGVGRLLHITAQDWKLILDRSTFRANYSSKNDSFIISDAFSKAGVTEIDDTAKVDTGRQIDDIQFTGTTLRQMMDTLTEITGFAWDVDAHKNLIYKAKDRDSAAFGFSDDPDNVGTFPFYNPSRVKTVGNFNSVEVVGGRHLSDDTIDTYSGDGTRTFFRLQVDGTISGNNYHAIFRAPTDASDPSGSLVTIQENTGTNASPTWTDRNVKVAKPGDEGNIPSGIDVLFFPTTFEVIWKTAPPNFTNSWRIKGRYWGQFIAAQKDEALIDSMGREFKKVLHVPDLRSQNEAIDVATAFLREQGPKDRLQITFTKDNLNIGEMVPVTSGTLGITAKNYYVHQLSYRLLGGDVAEYRAVLGEGSHSLAHLLTELRRKAGRADIPEDASTVFIRKVVMDGINGLQLEISKATDEARAGPYVVGGTDVRRNLVANPSFEDDESGWTDNITATGTIARTDEAAKFGDYSLKLEMTNSGASGEVVEKQLNDFLSFSVGDVFSYAIYAQVDELTNAKVVFEIQFNGAGTTATVEQTGTTTGFVRLTITNDAIPTGTTSVDLNIRIESTAASATGTAYVDGVQTEERSSLTDYFDGNESFGFWQEAVNNSESIKDAGGDAGIVDFAKVA